MAYYKCGRVYTTQNSNVVVDTASGAVANFNTQLGLPLIETKFGVKATQDLNGQSGPYPAGGGINRWNEEWELGAWSSVTGDAINYTDRIRCKNLIPVLPSTSYCIRFGTTASSVVNAHDENGDFIENLTTGTFGTGGRVVTTPANCHFIKFSVGTAYGTTYNNDISVNYPSTDTDYHPYSNICPIEGWSETKIAKRRKNLLDKSTYGFVNNGNIVFGGTAQGYADGSFKLKAGTYTFSVSVVCGGLYVSDTESSIAVVYNKTFITFTIAEDKAIRLMAYKSNVTKADILSYDYQVEVGSTTTDYEAYNGNTVTIALGGTYYGGYVTQDKAGHRQLVVTYGIDDMGDLTYTYSVWGAGSVFSVNLPLAKEQATSSQKGNIVSTIYKNISSSDMYNDNPNYSMCLNRQNVRIANPDYSNKDTFKTAMSGQKLIYELATPIIIDLPDGEPIKSFAGINNIFCDTGDTSLQFRKIG